MGGVMIRFVIAAFISIFMVKGAFADVEVFLVPSDLNYETNTSSEINAYLDNLKNNKSKLGVDGDAKVNNELNKYISLVNDKVSVFFSRNEFNKYRGDVCKISITTGNTAPSDPILTQVFTYNELADNKKQSCRKLNAELMKVVSIDKGLSYPRIVKDYGSLSIDMIFLFN